MIINNIRIIGCTLWTRIPDSQLMGIGMSMNDYRKIKIEEKGKDGKIKLRNLNPLDTTAIHEQDVEFIKKEIQKAKEEKNDGVVILTHHAPLDDSDIHCPQDLEYGIRKAMGTDLNLLGGNILAWLYGHTHW